MYRKIIVGLAATLFSAVMAGAVLAAPVNKTLFGTAIDGYDTVAYHTVGKPVEGSKKFTHDWMDATWRFASANNRNLFAANPHKYAPAYGGYCAYGVSQGAKVDIDPEAWRIVDGTLYLNVNKDVQRVWQQDIPGYIALADRKWPNLRDS